MAYSVATTFANSTNMVVGLLVTEFNRVRTWINRISNSDIANDALNERHLYKPESYGFPENATKGTLQEIYYRQGDPNEQTCYNFYPLDSGWGPKTLDLTDPHTAIGDVRIVRNDRVGISLAHMGPDNQVLVPDMCATVFLDRQSDVSITLQFEYFHQFNWINGPGVDGTAPTAVGSVGAGQVDCLYPQANDFDGINCDDGHALGRFAIQKRVRDSIDGTVTSTAMMSGSQRLAFPQRVHETTTGNGFGGSSLWAIKSQHTGCTTLEINMNATNLGEGLYDFGLVYEYAPPAGDVRYPFINANQPRGMQIWIGTRQMVVEVYKRV